MRSWLAITGVIALGCAGAPPPDVGVGPPELVLDGVTFRFFRDEALRAVGQAAGATFRRDTGDLVARKATVNIRDPKQSGPKDLGAERVAGNVRSGQGIAEGGVWGRDEQGTTFTTESCRFDGKAQTAEGEKPVRIDGEGLRMENPSGFAMDFSARGALRLKGPVTTTLGGSP
jgi:hypothetical protein